MALKTDLNVILFTDKFNTSVDIKLREWAETELPQQSIHAGREALKEEFTELMTKASETDPVYEPVKKEAVEEALRRHQWEERAQDVSEAGPNLFFQSTHPTDFF